MKKYIIWLVLVFFLNPVNLISSSETDRGTIENKIELAETYYMLMLDEGIGTYAQKKSETYIEDARKLLKKSSLSDGDNKKYMLQLNTIEKELNDSISVKYHTLDGYFPLLKYTASSFSLLKSRRFILLSRDRTI